MPAKLGISPDSSQREAKRHPWAPGKLEWRNGTVLTIPTIKAGEL